MAESWTVEELRADLERFEVALRAAGMSESTVATYVDRPARFIRWLAGEYDPGR